MISGSRTSSAHDCEGFRFRGTWRCPSNLACRGVVYLVSTLRKRQPVSALLS
jgi:hypothetical protein